jgi:hypothetical protein
MKLVSARKNKKSNYRAYCEWQKTESVYTVRILYIEQLDETHVLPLFASAFNFIKGLWLIEDFRNEIKRDWCPSKFSSVAILCGCSRLREQS